MGAVERIPMKENRRANVDNDRISNLPPDVIDNILQFLPFKDVAKTSILSTHWKYIWAHHPQLMLRDFICLDVFKLKKYGNSTSVAEGKVYSTLLDDILLRHVGPIRKFDLYFPGYFPLDADISRWIQFLSGKHLEDLLLHQEHFAGTKNRKLPSCLFTSVGFGHLTRLVLICCSLELLPNTFSGFPSLVHLRINIAFATQGDIDKLEVLISRCPLLEILSVGILCLQPFPEERCLNIHAPKLRQLYLNGCLNSIHLDETKHIKDLTLQVSWNQKANSTIEFFTCLPCLEELSLHREFWSSNWLGEFGRPAKFVFPNEYRHLNHLKLYSIPIHCQWAIRFLLCLFKAAPNLSKFEIDDIVANADEALMDNMIFMDNCCLKHLKCAKFTYWFRSSRVMLQLIRFILSSSPILEVLTIVDTVSVVTMDAQVQAEETLKNLNLSTELLQYRRASASAEIVLKLLHPMLVADID